MNRNDFPLLNNKIVYLDNAATTQKPKIVIDGIVDFYTKNNANVHRGIYSLSENATKMYEEARETVSKFINSSIDEVIFTSGTTAGLNMVADLIDFNNLFKKGDSILLSPFEHHSNFLPWQKISKKYNSQLEFVNITTDFGIDFEDLKFKVSNLHPRIVAITHISNVLGTILPIQNIIKEIRRLSPGTLIIVDAAQSIAHLLINVKELDCDFLVFSGHKIYGPTGIGVLFGKKSIMQNLTPVILGGGMIEKVTKDETTFIVTPSRFEAGTPNIEGAIGLGIAIKYIQGIGFEKILKYEKDLSDYAYQKLKEIENIDLYCSPNDDHIGVFSFNIKGAHPHDLAQILDESNICVRAGHHCAQILHRDILKVSASLRVSLSFYNEFAEIDYLVEKLIEAKNRLHL